ncbi:ABC transporter permease subunit [bacterium]|nr:ABC transporter permease subunit [bacterium]
MAVVLAGAVGRLLRGARRRNVALTGALAFGLAVPAPLVGLGLIALWNPGRRPAALDASFLALLASSVFSLRAWVYDGVSVLVLGYLARFLPIAVVLARSSFARVPPELEEASALSGRTRGERARSVVLPLAAPGLVASWVAVYVLGVAEFGTSVLVSPPGAGVLSVSVVNQVHYGQGPAVAAEALLLLGAVALPAAPVALVALALARCARGAAA